MRDHDEGAPASAVGQARTVAWRVLDVNPAKQGVDNPQRRRTEKRLFESRDSSLTSHHNWPEPSNDPAVRLLAGES